MARIFDEKFEGTGYEESNWEETVGAGAVVDEDALSSDVSSPSAWGTQCLKIDTNATVTYVRQSMASNLALSYFRGEFVVTAEGLSNDEGHNIFKLISGDWNIISTLGIFQDSEGIFHLVLIVDELGWVWSTTSFSLNTRYRFEFFYDANGGWEAKLDGVSIASGETTTHNGLQMFDCGDSDSAEDMTIYFDLIAVDNAAWVGAEASSTNFTQECIESITPSDTYNRTVTWSIYPTETITPSDVKPLNAYTQCPCLETVTLSDVTYRNNVLHNLLETITTLDTFNRTLTWLRTFSEDTILVDDIFTISKSAITLWDGIYLEDYRVLEFGKVVLEVITATDPANSTERGKQWLDSIVMSDNVQAWLRERDTTFTWSATLTGSGSWSLVATPNSNWM